MEELGWRLIAGQALSLVALAICILAFASKRDERLLALLISANVAFALHFALFGSWVAAGLTSLIVVRILLVQRLKGSVPTMLAFLAASGGVAYLTWQGPLDVFPLTASVLGTVGMFLLRGIAMRILLAGAALAWTLNNLLIGSIGGTIAEALVLATNLVTIARMAWERRAPAPVAGGRLAAPPGPGRADCAHET
ncbi:YgjV family protein [Aquisalimonas lutea]|uniref:YgjV family protein n=1 Tax=Aquisalimonas lutea TaxID=1327750 RepID=UPI0025B51418|nr:YgjV family protein [Aquisalimonas lutea]MDN3517284.1 YgjV family protein [Aquisalimonas lutea]